MVLAHIHLSPLSLLKEKINKLAFDYIIAPVNQQFYSSIAHPGELVGTIAAQSMGEPSTQMTLNSVDWDTKIVIMCDGKIITPQIGEWIDKYYIECEQSKIQHLENQQVYIELDDGHDWKALSCDEDGNMVWTKLEAITRHPVINEDGTDTILEVELDSGRTVRATKGKSFLTLIDGKIKPFDGYDLKVGDIIPISNSMASSMMNIIDTLNIEYLFPKTEWIYGTEVLNAINVKTTSNDRHWFKSNQGKLFTVPYTRSDGFCDAYTASSTSCSKAGTRPSSPT
jgi:DNA-directed RNA polymerase subunit A"